MTQSRVYINPRICEGCGDCGERSGCLSVRPVNTEFGRKTAIHQPSCNFDYSCVDGDCPAFMTLQIPVNRAHPVADPIQADQLPEPDVTAPDNMTMRLTGIGGTGVVTVSHILATAALSVGRAVRTLDQTGLAQKGGAVVSDVKLSLDNTPQSNRLARGECDLYLGFDLLVAAVPKNLAVANPLRTVAVVSTDEVPTGEMVTDKRQSFPSASSTVDSIRAACHPTKSRFLSAQSLSLATFNDDQFANLLLVGVAYQLGAIALPSVAIENAIETNGIAVEQNVQAFRRGRAIVAMPDSFSSRAAEFASIATSAGDQRVSSMLGDHYPSLRRAPQELRQLVTGRASDLVAYQSAVVADTYLQMLETVRICEETVTSATALTEAVARNLYKLTAYKDEYEVARLALDADVSAQLTETFGSGYRAFYHLHPPFLRAVGLQRKLRFGPWFAVVFRLLVKLRRLRGTPFDPFGYARIRRVERQLVVDYRDQMLKAVQQLHADNYPAVVQLASLPDMIRGYEDIKLKSVGRYHQHVRDAMMSLSDE